MEWIVMARGGVRTMNRRKYPYRGFMLDVSRHFMPVEDVCRVIEAAAICGMNRMHWHLTDDQGWRVEIVPEVEVPGHASAMLAAYPRFGCAK